MQLLKIFKIPQQIAISIIQSWTPFLRKRKFVSNLFCRHSSTYQNIYNNSCIAYFKFKKPQDNFQVNQINWNVKVIPQHDIFTDHSYFRTVKIWFTVAKVAFSKFATHIAKIPVRHKFLPIIEQWFSCTNIPCILRIDATKAIYHHWRRVDFLSCKNIVHS